MTPILGKAAHSVLLPAFSTNRLSDSVKQFLANGGCSILIGETREEYLARRMSDRRRATERAEDLIRLTQEAKSYSPETIVAVDQEIGGICRLHDLAPPFPAPGELVETATEDFRSLSTQVGIAAKDLGINCFLAPILDLVTGTNPWLKDRVWTQNPRELTRLSCAFIAGIQQAGVIACAKHFPGYGTIELDPAIDERARNAQPLHACKENIAIFRDAIAQGVEMIMAGPAIVNALDPDQPTSTSPSVIATLKNDLGFTGVVVSDDLDAKATLLGRSLAETAIQSLTSGCDLLLVAADGNTLSKLSSAICKAIEDGILPEKRLLQAAESVRSLAGKYS